MLNRSHADELFGNRNCGHLEGIANQEVNVKLHASQRNRSDSVNWVQLFQNRVQLSIFHKHCYETWEYHKIRCISCPNEQLHTLEERASVCIIDWISHFVSHTSIVSLLVNLNSHLYSGFMTIFVYRLSLSTGCPSLSSDIGGQLFPPKNSNYLWFRYAPMTI